MANINIADLFEIEQEPGSSYIKTAKQEMLSHQVFFDKPIGDPEQYRDLINLLYTCSELTEFNFFMNNSGGSLVTAMAIIEAIKATDGKVRAIITGECHSAASIITLNCHEIIVTDSAFMLVHTANYGSSGTVSNVQSHVDFSTKMINKLLDSTYAGFLTEPEMIDVRKGVEVWLDSDEIGKRLESRQLHLNPIECDTIKPVKKSRKS